MDFRLHRIAIRWSKIAHFKWVLQTLNILPCPWPTGSKLFWVRGFQKGAIRLCSSRGCKAAGPQSLAQAARKPAITIQNRKKPSLEPKISAFYLPPTLTVRSFETLWDCLVPHWMLSAIMSDCWELASQGCGSNFNVCYFLTNDPYFTS